MDCANTPDIKVITGIHRSGKSKLMDAFAARLKETDPHANIIHVNFNLTDYEDLLVYHKLEQYIAGHFRSGFHNFVIIDEIQMCTGYEKAVNSLHAKEKYDIYITGSNAFLQSSDLATLFAGRTFEIKVFPFSFSEYLCYFPSQNVYASLTGYFQTGGMSGSYVYSNPDQRADYLNNEVLQALIVRDIIQKEKIRNPELLERLIDYLMDNIGNLTSVRSISNSLKNSNINADHKTVGKYLGYLCSSFLFYRVRRFDIHGKKYLQSGDKYYLSDHSFRYTRLGTRQMDYGRILENIIAIELLRRGYEVYAGVLYKKEIDFVAVRRGKKMYIQVAYDVSNPDTFKRETAPLLQIKDCYPKIILVRTYQPETNYEGIRIIDAAEWLNIPQNRR
jgi:predicted AAA+ superfamily ATPase